ncbi:MAG: cyclase family protein [Clostridiales Family XIII bacterium]|jgi:kynurenine formamidase|nr:cyclase family protein [Clostridiales Family XIII bacterium]
MKLIDLSVYLEENPFAEPFPMSITFTSHTESAKTMAERLGLKPTDFNDSMSLTHEDFTGQFHCGTHVDAPLHFGPVIEGKPAKGIDELPLEWFFNDGVRLDVRDVGRGELITKTHIEDALKKTGCKLKPLDIVLIWSDFDKLIYTPEYLSSQPGMSREATEYLLDFGIKVIGVDMYGYDRSFHKQAEAYKSGESAEMFPGHMVGREREYVHMEKLANFDKLPGPAGYKVACFPVKGKHCTAGQSRIVAFVE